MLLDYDTIILDLDFTIWTGCKPAFWAKLLEPPYKIDGYRFYGAGNTYIELHSGIQDVLKILYENKKNIGFASRGALNDIPWMSQPSIMALNEFKIHYYFNYQKILVFKTVDKIPFLKPLGKTIYIDDNEDELKRVISMHGDKIDVINRNTFNNWRSIL